MNKERLERLIVVMERVRDQREFFDMDHWTRECGTASCALGWAASDPSFREQGLRLDRGGLPTSSSMPYFEGSVGTLAGVSFFDITHHAASHLFSPDEYKLPKRRKNIRPNDVIRHIREVIAADGRAPGEKS